ncbi:MAG TPA: hypothetical protein VK391_06955, partial [Allosphingosinicella sp.]|nr:hypothetical protein [Allosphingosinicella sp.]
MKSLRLTVSALALTFSAPALADANHDCLDKACTMVSLFAQPAPSQAGGSGTINAARMGTWGIDTAGMD